MAIIVATAAVGILVIIRHRESIGLGRQRWIRFNRYRSAGGLLCLLILTMTLVQFNDEIINTPSSSGKNKVSAAQLTPFVEPVWSLNTLNERFFLWHKSLAMAKANPLLGVGLGQWRLTFPAHGKIRQFRKSDEGRLAEISFKRPHNDYVWVLSETGMIGLLSYLAIVGIAIFYALKIYFKSDDTDNRALAIFMLFGIIGYMVISFFSFPKERIVPSIFFMLNLACIVSTYHRSFPKKFKFNRQQFFFINSLTLIVLSFCMIVGYICLDSETHVKKALIARQETNWQTVIEEIDKAESSFYQLDPVSVPLAWYRGVANQLLGRLDEALDDFKRAYQIHPNHIHVLNNLGTGYAQTGDYENAAEYYKKALDVWPEFAEARINLGVIYFHLGDFTKARHCFMLLDPNHEDARVSVYLQFIENRLGKSIQHKIIS
jgi:tetratricopeptide (TPR) repeat protein